MKRCQQFFVIAMLALVILTHPNQIEAQSSDPDTTVQSLIQAVNTQDAETISGLFAEDAIATFIPAPPWGESARIGKDAIRDHFTGWIADNGQVNLGDCDLQGATTVCTADVTGDGPKALGFSSLEFEAAITIHSGHVQSYHWTMAEESQARVQEAIAIAVNLQVAQRFVDEFANGGDLDVADELISPDFVDHGISPGNVNMDREGLKQAMAGVHAGFGSPFVIEDMITQGDKVAIRGRFQAVHEGEFLGIPPSGKELIHTWIVILRIENGQIIERWANIDELKFLIDLGLVNPPGE